MTTSFRWCPRGGPCKLGTAFVPSVVLGLVCASSASAGRAGSASAARGAGLIPFEGSTIVSMAGSFAPGFLYMKFPVEQAVVPGQPWQLSFGVQLVGQTAPVAVSLRLGNAAQNPDVNILVDSAEFVLQDGLHNNFDAAERFEIEYAGALSPYLGPVDFVLEPDGFPEMPVRVHLSVTEQPGFPLAFFPSSSSVPVVGNIVGDAAREIVVFGAIGSHDGQHGLYAFDPAGNVLPGWPLFNDEPDVVFQAFPTPVTVDLDGDGLDEIVAVDVLVRNVARTMAKSGTVPSTSLYAVDGSGQIRWQVEADFEEYTIPAVADLDGDLDLDIVVGTQTNLMRFEADGTPLAGWAVETLNDIHVTVPIIADTDGNPSNGMEIVSCSPVFGPDPRGQVYVWRQDGTPRGGTWPKELTSCVAPAVVDLDGNPSNGKEIVMAIDFFEDPPVDPETGFLNTFTVFAWHGDGSEVSGWPHRFLRDPNAGFIDDRITPSVSAADLDRDGDVEVVVATYGGGDPVNGNLFVFHHDGTLDADWPRWAGIAQTPSPWGGASLGDLDGDGLLEIVTGSFRGAYVFRASGEEFGGFPRLTGDIFPLATIADLDGDARMEIIQGSFIGGRLHVWHMLTPSANPLPWPLFRQNAQNTGAIDPAARIPTVSEVGLAATGLLLLAAGIVVLRRRGTRPVG